MTDGLIDKRLKAKVSGQVSDGRNRFRLYSLGSVCDLTSVEWMDILIAADGVCQKCGVYVGIERLTIEHVIPLWDGGNHTKSNVIPACRICNMGGKSYDLPKKPRQNLDWIYGMDHQFVKVCMPKELIAMVREIADKERRPMGYQVIKLLEEALDQRKEGGDE